MEEHKPARRSFLSSPYKKKDSSFPWRQGNHLLSRIIKGGLRLISAASFVHLSPEDFGFSSAALLLKVNPSKGPSTMLFTKVEISLIVEQSDGKNTVEDSHKFIDKIALAGTPVYDSAVTAMTVSGVKNAAQIRREFRKR